MTDVTSTPVVLFIGNDGNVNDIWVINAGLRVQNGILTPSGDFGATQIGLNGYEGTVMDLDIGVSSGDPFTATGSDGEGITRPRICVTIHGKTHCT
jgi:hypothetical protein